MTTDSPKFIERDKDLIPPVLVRAMLLLVVSTLTLTSFAVLSNRDPAAMPLKLGEAPVIAERTFILGGDPISGSAKLTTLDGTVISDLGTNEGGFLATVLRVLKRSRMQRGVEMAVPVRLVEFENGQLTLIDTADGTPITLNGFGPDNEAAFAKLLEG